MTLSPPPSALRRSPLHDRHVAASAVFTEFAGWEMPVRYGSDLAEHHAVRSAAGLFDLSHMAEIRVDGPEALAVLGDALAGDFAPMTVGRAKYTLMLGPGGGIVDDLVVYRVGEDDYLVVANASNREPVLAGLARSGASRRATVTDETDDTALIAVQGPASESVLAALEPLRREDGDSFSALGYYRCASARFGATPVLVARTGYTGEDGFELYLPAAAAPELWDALLAAGSTAGIVPCGLACRDTLRLEAGMPLYGHELDESIRPAQAGLGKVVADGKDGGARPDDPVLVGLRGEGRRALRAGYALFAGPDADDSLGRVTSGALSPTLGYPIAMAYVDPGHAEPGTVLYADLRGARVPVTITKIPFYRRKKDNRV